MNYGTCYIPEGQLIIDCLLDASIRGTGKNNLTPIFPCGIFQLKKGINRKPGDPNYHLFRKALESTSKRIYPNYANCDWSNQKAWKKADIEVKERVIGELNDVEIMMLVERLKNDKTLAEKDKKRKIYELIDDIINRSKEGQQIPVQLKVLKARNSSKFSMLFNLNYVYGLFRENEKQ